MSELLLDAAGRRRSPATLPEFYAGRPPRNKGMVAVGTALRRMRLGRPPAQIPACAANARGSCLGCERRIGLPARDAGCGQAGASE